MASDPERIEALQHDYERRVRASTPREGPGFGTVLERAPAFDPDDDGRDDDESDSEELRDKKGAKERSAKREGSEDESEAPAAKEDLPKVPPDPRMRALHAAFGAPAPKAPAAVPASVDAGESPRSRSVQDRDKKARSKRGRSSP